MNGLLWTEEEILGLKEMYSCKNYMFRPIPDVLRNRTPESIFQKACMLKISRPKTILKDIGTKRLDISETDKAYLAGIIDGEGHIVIRGIRKDHKEGVTIGITNTDENLIRWIEDKLKMICTHSKSRAKRDGKGHFGTKQTWLLSIERASSAYILLEAIVPYLIIKKQKAIQAMDCIRSKYAIGV